LLKKKMAILQFPKPTIKNDTMFNLIFLSKENDLNKILRNQKRNKDTINILFISLWDDYCNELVDKIKEKYSAVSDAKEDLYIVDSFNMPHSFVIYEVTKTPELVILRKDKPAFIESYLPKIYDYLNIK